jgi:hypothetical protein
MAARIQPRHHQSQFVSFSPRICEENNLKAHPISYEASTNNKNIKNGSSRARSQAIYLEISGKLRCQSLCKVYNGMIQIQNRRVLQAICLVNNCCHHIWVTVPTTHSGYPTKGIQISTALFVI